MHKKLLALLLSGSMALSTLSVTGVYAADGEVIIYHTNDIHGYVQGDGESIIGIDTVAELKAATEVAIALCGGDMTRADTAIYSK